MDDVLHQCHKNAKWITDGTLCSNYFQQLSSSSGSINTIIDNSSDKSCYGFFTDATASKFVSIGNPLKKQIIGRLDFGNLKITTAVISCYYHYSGVTYPYLSPCGYDSSIVFNQPGKKYMIKSADQNCVLTQEDF